MELFYLDKEISGIIALNEEESKHLIRVLRYKKGDSVYLTNGKGDFCKAEIADENPKACLVNVMETTPNYRKRNYRVHIAIAPTKNNERLEWFLEKATEIGVDEITPIICDHSERREVKTDRMNKVILAAMKQSVKAYLPNFHDAVPFRNFIQGKFSSLKFLCSMGASREQLLQKLYTKGNDALILIGPEGDFSTDEIELAKKNNFEIVSLGESRLRTETAGIAACHTISMMNQ
jgi:16S rRNA (uracil1498-N3)-methyltransferase